MITEETKFADVPCARLVLSSMYPDAERIEVIEHGYDNIVGLVDEKYAVRFPRNANAYKRSLYEKSVLMNIKNVTNVAIPKVLGERENPPCAITTFLRGRHLSPKEIDGLSYEEQVTFGSDVGRFAYDLHRSLDLDEARQMRDTLGLDTLEEEPWDIHLEKTLSLYTFPTKKQDELAKQYYELWKRHQSGKNQVVVHDDLHTENMMFEDGRLVGVLDFGDTNVGTPEQELRQLYYINELVVQSAADTYSQLSGLRLDIEAIKIWAIAHEMASYSERLATNNSHHPSFARASRNLNKWLPEGEWGDGSNMSQRKSLQ